MGRKGKAPKTAPVPAPRVDMTLEARRERLLGLGLSREEVEAHLAVTAASTTTEPTTLCTEHVPSEERPLECAKCGKPLALVQRDGERKFVEAEAEARQSEKRFEDAPLTDDEWADITTPEERGAPLCAVMTPEQLAAVLDNEPEPITAHSDLVSDELRRAADDGPSHEGNRYVPVHLSALWSMRLGILAKEAGADPASYCETLIRRQWVARGKGG